MKDLAPNIYRQRLLIEGTYTIEVSEDDIRQYFNTILSELNLTSYKDPIIHNSLSEGIGKEENQGFEAFIPLIESGIAVYTWSKDKFFSIVLFTCKEFNDDKAITVTKKFFQADRVETKSF